MKIIKRILQLIIILSVLVIAFVLGYPYAEAFLGDNSAEPTPVEERVKEKYLSLGNTLTQEDIVKTTKLLNGEDVSEENILYVDGMMVNEYLNDGSNPSTRVFSSVSIEPREEGAGVQVDIMTPENITRVSQVTYQNAAINSGAKDLHIRVASLHPVDGSGALVGLYALLEKNNVGSKDDYRNSNDQVDLVINIQDVTGKPLSDINQFFIDLRLLIISYHQDGQEIDESMARDILAECLSQYDFELSQELKDALVKFIIDFDNSSQVDNPEFIDEIDKVKPTEDIELPSAQNISLPDINVSPEIFKNDWHAILSSLPQDTTSLGLSNQDLIQALSLDFTEYGDIHPIIPAMYQKMISNLNNDESEDLLISLGKVYSHTFLVEHHLELSVIEQTSIDYLRTLLYIASEMLYQDIYASFLNGGPIEPIKTLWLEGLDKADSLNMDEETRAAIQAISNRTGWVLETSSMNQVGISEDGQYVRMPEGYIALAFYEGGTQFSYNLKTGQVGQYDSMLGGGYSALIPRYEFYFESEYGIGLDESE